MEIIYDEPLTAYMSAHPDTDILVDIASSNTCDLDVTEMYMRFISKKHADRLLGSGKGYRAENAPLGRLVFPPYHMHIDDTVSVYLKNFLFIKWLKYEGLKL